MNFIEEFNKGQSSSITGIPFGKNLENITSHTGGIFKGRMYVIAGPEKSGKTTFTDYAFVLQPYLYSLVKNLKIRWIYYSLEIDRISKEFDYAAFFLNHDYGIEYVALPDNVKKFGESYIPLSPDYLRGMVLDDNFNKIKINPSLKPLLIEVYEKRIVPLFGEFDKNGVQFKKGLIEFKEKRENPTGIYKDLIRLAEREGDLLKDSFNNLLNYTPRDKEMFTIVILDHIRKVKIERGFTVKQTIDKVSEYLVELRDVLKYTFVPVVHTNRNLASISNLNFAKGEIYPTNDDLKDSGNLGEDCNYLFTTFNPNDDKFQLKSHFGFPIRNSKGDIINENLKTIHLASSRHCLFPRHFKINMLGNIKKFEKVN